MKYCLVKIYEGKPKNKGSEVFRYTPKAYTRIKGAFCSGNRKISLAIHNGKKLILQNLRLDSAAEMNPNGRPLIFDHAIESQLITGVISGDKAEESTDMVSVYLIMEEA